MSIQEAAQSTSAVNFTRGERMRNRILSLYGLVLLALSNDDVSIQSGEIYSTRHSFRSRYKDLLFGDISAVCAFKRLQHLRDLLEAKVSS